jgi:hypothetical protein
MPQCKLCKRFADEGKSLCDKCSVEDNELANEIKNEECENTTKKPSRTSSLPSSQFPPSESFDIKFTLASNIIITAGRIPGPVEQVAIKNSTTAGELYKYYFGKTRYSTNATMINGIKRRPNYTLKEGDVVLFVNNDFPEGIAYAKSIAKNGRRPAVGTFSKSMARRLNMQLSD